MEEPYRYIILVIITLGCQVALTYYNQRAKNKADLSVKAKLTSIEDGIKTANALQLDRSKQIFSEEKDSIIVFFAQLNTWIWISLNLNYEDYDNIKVDDITRRRIIMQDEYNKTNVAFTKMFLIIKDNELIEAGQDAITKTYDSYSYKKFLLEELTKEIDEIKNLSIPDIEFEEKYKTPKDQTYIGLIEKGIRKKSKTIRDYIDTDEEIFNTAIDAVNNFKNFAQKYLRKESPTN